MPGKKDFYSNLIMEDVKDSDYNHAKRVCKDSELKKHRWIPWFVS